MGELFRRFRPETASTWTGDSLVNHRSDATEGEHLHRYFIARDLCRGKSVLDFTCGDGAGSALLAQTALHVTGVDLSATAIDFANQNHQSQNLVFLKAAGSRIPLEAASVAAVVSFESLQQIQDLQTFLFEVRRVLQPGGFLILSERDVSAFAVNALTGFESNLDTLAEALKVSFRQVAILHQRSLVGSAILPHSRRDSAGQTETPTAGAVYEQRGPDTFESNPYLARSSSWIALASDASLPPLGPSLYIQNLMPGSIPPETQAELRRLQALEASFLAPADPVPQTNMAVPVERRQQEPAPEPEQDTQLESDLELEPKDEPVPEQGTNHEPIDEAAEEPENELDENASLLEELTRKLHSLQRQLESSALFARQQSLLLRRSQLSFHAQARAVLNAEEVAQQQAKLARDTRSETALTMIRYQTLAAELNNVRAQLEHRTALLHRLADVLLPQPLRRFMPAKVRGRLNRFSDKQG